MSVPIDLHQLGRIADSLATKPPPRMSTARTLVPVQPTGRFVSAFQPVPTMAPPPFRFRRSKPMCKDQFPWAKALTTVGVTGTNGKTSTALLVASAIHAAHRSVLVETTLGYEFDRRPLDIPRNLDGFLKALFDAARAGCHDVCLEVTSFALSTGFAARWPCDVAVFTNLTHDHLGAHGSWEHYLASKAQLFMHLPESGTAVLNAGDPSALKLVSLLRKGSAPRFFAAPSRPVCLPSELGRVHLEASVVRVDWTGTHITLKPSVLADALGREIQVKMVGQVFAENALGAALAADARGVEGVDIARGLAQCEVPPGRFEVVTRNPTTVLDYAHSPDALARVLADARRLAGSARLIVVFGAGGGADAAKREPMGEAVGRLADMAIVTNDNPRLEPPDQIADALVTGIRAGGKAVCRVELDRGKAIGVAMNEARASDVVIVAGKGHEKGQTIGNETLPHSDYEAILGTRARLAMG